MNPLEIAGFEAQWIDAVDPGALLVCVPFWELPLVPKAWARMLEAMHVIMAPTRFIQDACAAVVPLERVLHYPQAVFLPGDVRSSRDAWGLSKTATIFAVSFDAGSDIERKNPLASVEAFRRAFPGASDVQLVIKVRPSPHSPEFQAQIDALKSMVGPDRRIRVVEQSLTYVQVLQLYASCDVMLSLHRSEGLGLHIMEAMSLGKVVVGTNWSGNTDFMTAENSVPVGYRLIPVATKHGAYGAEVGREGQVWADPDVSEAADALRVLYSDPQRRHRLGAAAATAMEKRRQAMLSGGAFDELERALARSAVEPVAMATAVRETRRFLFRRLNRIWHWLGVSRPNAQ